MTASRRQPLERAASVATGLRCSAQCSAGVQLAMRSCRGAPAKRAVWLRAERPPAVLPVACQRTDSELGQWDGRCTQLSDRKRKPSTAAATVAAQRALKDRSSSRAPSCLLACWWLHMLAGGCIGWAHRPCMRPLTAHSRATLPSTTSSRRPGECRWQPATPAPGVQSPDRHFNSCGTRASADTRLAGLVGRLDVLKLRRRRHDAHPGWRRTTPATATCCVRRSRPVAAACAKLGMGLWAAPQAKVHTGRRQRRCAGMQLVAERFRRLAAARARPRWPTWRGGGATPEWVRFASYCQSG